MIFFFISIIFLPLVLLRCFAQLWRPLRRPLMITSGPTELSTWRAQHRTGLPDATAACRDTVLPTVEKSRAAKASSCFFGDFTKVVGSLHLLASEIRPFYAGHTLHIGRALSFWSTFTWQKARSSTLANKLDNIGTNIQVTTWCCYQNDRKLLSWAVKSSRWGLSQWLCRKGQVISLWWSIWLWVTTRRVPGTLFGMMAS